MSTSRSTKNEFLKMSQPIRSGTHCICVCQNCSRPKQRCKELCQFTGKSTITYNQILSKLKCCWIFALFVYFLQIGLILYISGTKTWRKYLIWKLITPARIHSITGLESRVLKMIVKSGLEFFLFWNSSSPFRETY